MVRVLHITETYAAGVGNAIDTFAKNSLLNCDNKAIEHYLCYTNSRGHKMDSKMRLPTEGLYIASYKLPYKNISSFLTLEVFFNRVAKEVNPDYVHLHSSYAGIIGRFFRHIFKRQNADVKIVYSPHGLSYQRQDLRPIILRSYQLIEKLFAAKTDIFAVCSNYEREGIKAISSKDVVFIPNISNMTFSIIPSNRQRQKVLDLKKVVTVGRDAPQKNYQFLKLLEAESYEISILSGLTQNELKHQLLNSSIYIQTSLSEGFPISLLDAIKCRLPIIALKKPYLKGAPEEYLFEDADGAKKLINQIIESVDEANLCAKSWADAFSNFNDDEQIKALGNLYK